MNLRPILTFLLASATIVSATAALAQDKGSVNPKPLPPLANPNDPKLGAKELFGRKILPAAMPTRCTPTTRSPTPFPSGASAGCRRSPRLSWRRAASG